MLRPASRALFIVASLVFTGAFLSFAFFLPAFHHADELGHFDYALKLARGGDVRDGALVEKETHEIWFNGFPKASAAYAERAGKPNPSRQLVSDELKQPPLFYLLLSGVSRAGDVAGMTALQQLYAMRVCCVVMSVAARLLTLLAAFRLSPSAGVFAAVYLLLFIPVDLARVSNDSLAHLLGSAVFYLLVREPGERRRSTTILLASLFVALVFTKLTAVLFVGPMYVASELCRPHLFRARVKRLALTVGPGVVAGLALAWYNISTTGSATGINPQHTVSTVPALGMSALYRILTIDMWIHWHKSLLIHETLIQGNRSIHVYSVDHLLTWIVFGQLLCLVYFCRREKNTVPLIPAEGGVSVPRLALMCFLSLFGAIIVMQCLRAFVGQVWYLGRLLVPVEGPAVCLSALGYALVFSQQTKMSKRMRLFAIVAGALLFITPTIRYFLFFSSLPP